MEPHGIGNAAFPNTKKIQTRSKKKLIHLHPIHHLVLQILWAHPWRRVAIPSLRCAIHGSQGSQGVAEGSPGGMAQAEPGAGHGETRRVKTFAQEKVAGNTGLRFFGDLADFGEM